MSKRPAIVAVDLTPVLPGGENGGAKVFVLELLRQLARIAPATQFVLLTNATSHAELANLDRPNMRRCLAVTAGERNGSTSQWRAAVRGLRLRIPEALRRRAMRVAGRLRAARGYARARSLLQDIRADLLFCPFTAPTFHQPGVPTVCTIYDLQFKTYPEFFSSQEVAERGRAFAEACRRASALAAISDYARDSAAAHAKLEPGAIRTIHIRMARRMPPAVRMLADTLDRWGLKATRYLIYPANFWKHKNHEMLLTAFGLARRAMPQVDIKLVCTGAPGARRDWLTRAAAAMALGDHVVFPGYVGDGELAALVGGSAGVVFPSLYEGFGLPVIEAMAAGVPVACSNVTALPEVAAEAALLFDPRVPTAIADAMTTLVQDDARRAQLIAAGKRRAEVFEDTERMAREYLDLFGDALAHARHASDVTGVYADGWAGAALHVHVAPGAGRRQLELDFSLPEWAPQNQLSIVATSGGREAGARLQLRRGESRSWSLPLNEAGGRYEVDIAPTFVPVRWGIGADPRELSVMLRQCRVVSGDGECVQLFPPADAT